MTDDDNSESTVKEEDGTESDNEYEALREFAEMVGGGDMKQFRIEVHPDKCTINYAGKIGNVELITTTATMLKIIQAHQEEQMKQMSKYMDLKVGIGGPEVA